MTWRQMSTEHRRVHAAELTGPAGSLVQTAPLNDEQSAIPSPAEWPNRSGWEPFTPPEQDERSAVTLQSA